MTDKRSMIFNALMSTVQVIVNAAVLFILYRYLLETIGGELAGVWALVLSWTSASSIASLGLAGGAVKFVARHLARKDHERVLSVVQTSVLSVAAFLALVLPLLYPVFLWLIRELVEPVHRIPDALSILPYAIGSFWLTSIALVIQSSIDGTQRVYLRNLLVMCSAITYLLLTILLVPLNGLVGLAQAQVIQAGLLLIAGWIVLRHLLPSLPLIPLRWRWDVFKEMFSYSVNFQVIGFWALLFEPVTKSLFSKFGGVSTVFFFEMANKMVLQLRSIVVTAHQSIVPAIAHLQESDAVVVQEIYKKSFRLLLFLVIPSLPFFIAVTPVISRLWIGAYEEIFVVSGILLFVAWFLNILTNPAYFGYLGIGKLRWNVINHAIAGVLNAGLGGVLGWFYGGTGVIIGFAVGIFVGSMITMLAYHHEYDIHFSDLLEWRNAILFAAGLGGLAVDLYLYETLQQTWSPITLAAAQVGIYLAIIAVPMWFHPLRSQIQTWVASMFVRRAEMSHPSSS